MDRRALLVRYSRQAGECVDGFDDRTTANSGPGRAPSGQTWQVMSTSEGGSYRRHGVIGGAAYESFADSQHVVVDVGFADGSIQATLADQGAGNVWRLEARMSDLRSGGGFNGLYVHAGAVNWSLNRRVHGSNTVLGTYAAAPVNGDVCKLTCRGNQLEVFINGTSRIGPVTDGWNLGATLWGYSILGDTAVRMDALSVMRV